MLLKQDPQDFIVNEIYDIEQLKEEKGVGGNYAYFIFTKTNLAQQKAIIFLAQKLKIASKRIHFCGTKDKVAISTQLISIQQCNREKAEEFQDIINLNSEDMRLEYIGQFNQRLNLSNNQGNHFQITLRGLNANEKEICMQQHSEFNVYNYYQSQRFGVCANTHHVGLMIIRNNIKDAVFEILSSLPHDIRVNHAEYVELCIEIRDNFQDLSQEELREKYMSLKELFPQFLNGYESLLTHLINTPKDVSGALRTIPKKLRTLYIHAFQSAIFNEVVSTFVMALEEERKANITNEKSAREEHKKESSLNAHLYLVGEDMMPEMSGYEKSVEILNRLHLSIDDLKLSHMPELQLFAVKKPLYSEVEGFTCQEIDETTLKLCFSLGPGCYATQVINEIFEDEEIVTF